MSKELVRIPRKQVCIGDLKHRIVLHTRTLKEPGFGEVNPTENFGGDEVWARVKTAAGKVLFNGVTDEVLTHEIFIRYNPKVTSQTWIEFRDRNFRIVNVEDYNEENEFMRLRCIERGDKSVEATKA